MHPSPPLVHPQPELLWGHVNKTSSGVCCLYCFIGHCQFKWRYRCVQTGGIAAGLLTKYLRQRPKTVVTSSRLIDKVCKRLDALRTACINASTQKQQRQESRAVLKPNRLPAVRLDPHRLMRRATHLQLPSGGPRSNRSLRPLFDLSQRPSNHLQASSRQLQPQSRSLHHHQLTSEVAAAAAAQIRAMSAMPASHGHSAACCNIPPIVSKGYKPKGSYEEIGGYKTCMSIFLQASLLLPAPVFLPPSHMIMITMPSFIYRRCFNVTATQASR